MTLRVPDTFVVAFRADDLVPLDGSDAECDGSSAALERWMLLVLLEEFATVVVDCMILVEHPGSVAGVAELVVMLAGTEEEDDEADDDPTTVKRNCDDLINISANTCRNIGSNNPSS